MLGALTTRSAVITSSNELTQPRGAVSSQPARGQRPQLDLRAHAPPRHVERVWRRPVSILTRSTKAEAQRSMARDRDREEPEAFKVRSRNVRCGMAGDRFGRVRSHNEDAPSSALGLTRCGRHGGHRGHASQLCATSSTGLRRGSCATVGAAVCAPRRRRDDRDRGSEATRENP